MKYIYALLFLAFSSAVFASGGGNEDPDPKGIKYFEVFPSLTTNYMRDDGKIGHISIGVQLKIKGAVKLEKVKPHQPLVQDTLLWLFRSQTAETVKSLEARETLRAEALKQINEKLLEVTKSKKDLVEDVLFTKFVYQ